MNKGSIVERLCSDLDHKEPRYKCATLLYFYFIHRCLRSIRIEFRSKYRQKPTVHSKVYGSSPVPVSDFMKLIYLSNRGSLALNDRVKYLLLQVNYFEEIGIEVLLYCCYVDTCILRCMAGMQKLDIMWTNKLPC